MRILSFWIGITVLFSGYFVYHALHNELMKEDKGSFSPLFQYLGKGPQAFNRSMSAILPVSDVDEAKYGEAIRMRYGSPLDTLNPTHVYLNKLVNNLSNQVKEKKFSYHVLYREGDMIPNAFALPGGVIFVTEGLLQILSSEAELISILSHEIGHIELGHCLNAVKFELAAKKIKKKQLGALADFAFQVLMRNSYSKSQENESDEYAMKVLSNSKYDPTGLAMAFTQLKNYQSGYYYDDRESIIQAYTSSHPSLDYRLKKSLDAAEGFWIQHPDESRYWGGNNFYSKIPMFQQEYPEEFITRNEQYFSNQRTLLGTLDSDSLPQ